MAATLEQIRMLRLAKRHWLGLSGVVVPLAIVAAALLAPELAPYDPNDQLADGISADASPLPPSHEYLLGTDLLGRDLLSRLPFGAGTSLVIGMVANGTSITIGTLPSLVAGYVRGTLGGAIMRFTALMMAFPALLFAIARQRYSSRRCGSSRWSSPW